MKKIIQEYKDKNISEINVKIASLREEVAKLKLSSKVKIEKDTNLIDKSKKEIARLLTLLKQKQLGILK